MRSRVLPLCGIALLVPVRLAFADPDPAPPFDSTIIDRTAYDLTVVGPGADSLGPYEYEYTVTFNGGDYANAHTTNPGSIRADGFVIYADNPKTVSGSSVVLFSDSKVSYDDGATWHPLWGPGITDGANPFWEWKWGPNPYKIELYRDHMAKFTITTKDPLNLDHPPHTAFHIKWEGGSAWINNTPELPPSLLTMVSFGGLALLRRRRGR